MENLWDTHNLDRDTITSVQINRIYDDAKQKEEIKQIVDSKMDQVIFENLLKDVSPAAKMGKYLAYFYSDNLLYI